MLEDKSKVNYPYEFTETITTPIKNQIIQNLKIVQTHNLLLFQNITLKNVYTP